jgi:hypothetical protein
MSGVWPRESGHQSNQGERFRKNNQNKEKDSETKESIRVGGKDYSAKR